MWNVQIEKITKEFEEIKLWLLKNKYKNTNFLLNKKKKLVQPFLDYIESADSKQFAIMKKILLLVSFIAGRINNQWNFNM